MKMVYFNLELLSQIYLVYLFQIAQLFFVNYWPNQGDTMSLFEKIPQKLLLIFVLMVSAFLQTFF